jgi:predicted site-specific integrase-resolvase
VNLVAWAERNGVAGVTGCRWFRAGMGRSGRLAHERARRCVRGFFGRSESRSLNRQVGRVTVWAIDQQIRADTVVVEVGCALNGQRGKFVALLGDPWVHRIVGEHRDRLCGM